jgi:hypothetical protein
VRVGNKHFVIERRSLEFVLSTAPFGFFVS